ncbi:MAG: RNA polymerase sigma factor [Vicinamibacterales bacterium]
MPDVTLSALEPFGAAAASEDTFQMDEDAFRVFYERTARPVWAYLSRMSGDPRLADDLLQETYYRFLRAQVSHESEAHRRNYLFRIATNLVRDLRRRPRLDHAQLADGTHGAEHADPQSTDVAGGAVRRLDLSRSLARLKPRERDLLWLAYAQGSSHKEIAETLGLKTASVKLLLFRARRRLAALLREGGRAR